MNAKQPRSKTAPARTSTAFRISVDDLAEIDRLAKSAGLTRTDYLISCALGRLEAGKLTIDERLEALEDRIIRLEESEFGR